MDLNMYTEEMAKSAWDKSFFMDKILGAKCVVDFGCADASMICMLGKIFPSVHFFGYDNNEQLLDMARENIANASENVHAVYGVNDLDAMIARIKRTFKSHEICLNFSSVLHEVFSNTGGLGVIEKLVFELKPKYITIRDMYYHHDSFYDEYEELSTLQRVYVLSMCSNCKPGCHNQYVNKFGNINTMKSLVHFLMKYQWRDNDYEQELKEDYFSWQIDDVQKLVKNYSVIFETHYMLPYYVEKWKEYGISSKVHTHAQFILRRND